MIDSDSECKQMNSLRLECPPYLVNGLHLHWLLLLDLNLHLLLLLLLLLLVLLLVVAVQRGFEGGVNIEPEQVRKLGVLVPHRRHLGLVAEESRV